ncbi:restriction endonuclease subunit S [Myroides odoratimimus]|uniref:restriction endonuclease subunit S n=1 Tax=Myroides odoratimimus TaxID=76832 RepID=UPI0025759B7A|nr:restriction endonuclease subunit S [Myroides odoratimimus]MDM1410734.1 restriction endonuclease subunit S [Myroides odoratimimus]MDM1519366.1 restriction endonuclease subunit S [Myroides odoratimimus]MEC4007684.1 restriction endonuclease subunit S [Myroides odoratimimus]
MVKQGYKQTEIGVIPEDWEVKELGECVDYVKGYPFKSKDYLSDGIRIIRISDTTYNSIKDDGAIYVSKSVGLKLKNWELNEGDIIVTTVGSKPPMYDSMVGKTIFIKKRYKGALLNQNAVLFRNKNNSFQILLNSIFKQKRYIEYIESIFRGNANQASITLDELFKFKIPLPPLAEQKAIAAALSDADAWIESLEQLITKKRLIKQGAMQTLFTPKEGWEVKKLVEVCDNIIDYRGVTPKKLGMDWGDGDIVALSAGNVKKGYIDFNIECYLGSESLYKRWMRNGNPKKGDIVFTLEAPLGNIALIPDNKKYILSQRTILLQLNEKYSSQYIFQLMLSNKFQNYINERATGSTAQGIKRQTFEKLTIHIPSFLEQERIATILSDMDAELKALENQLAKARQIKQGMMQELLTGRVRLV